MKNRTLLRILAVLMAVVMVCVLAACGNKNAGETNPTDGTQPSDNPTTEETGDNGGCEDATTDTPDTTEGTVGGGNESGNGNTGNGNTGNGNTGNGNTGNGNTGNGNTGNGNTGDGNTGNGNTGDGNTGNGGAATPEDGDIQIPITPEMGGDGKEEVIEPSEPEETVEVNVTEPSEETQPKDDPDPTPSTQPDNVIDFDDLLNAGRG